MRAAHLRENYFWGKKRIAVSNRMASTRREMEKRACFVVCIELAGKTSLLDDGEFTLIVEIIYLYKSASSSALNKFTIIAATMNVCVSADRLRFIGGG